MDVNIEESNGMTFAGLTVEALDASNANEFKQDMGKLIDKGRRVVLDLEAVRFVDSSGLGAILSVMRELGAADGSLQVCGVSKPVRALFELVRFHRILDIYNSRDEVLRAAQQ